MNDTNALLIGLLRVGDVAGAIVKLRRYDGSLVEVAEHVGADPWEVLGVVLKDCEEVKAKGAVIFANFPFDTRMDWPRGGPTTWQFNKWGKWEINTGEVDEWQRLHAVKFIVLRQLFRYQCRWVEVTPDRLKSTGDLIMKAVVSPADVDRAKAAVVAAVATAYGPMDVNGEKICWAGRIARAESKADGLVSSGALTRDQVDSIIADFRAQQETAKAAAQRAYDDYHLLCYAAGLDEIKFTAECACAYCRERAEKTAMKEFVRAINYLYRTDANEAAIDRVRKIIAICKALNVDWSINHA